MFVITEKFINYTMNGLDLIFHNATRDSMGIYACYANDTDTVYKVISIAAVECKYFYACRIGVMVNFNTGPPESLSELIQTVIVSVSEEVILNCTVSASPDPVYSWSFPDSCSSCPDTSNDSVLIFTAEDITDSGEYTCVAENQYGNLSVTFYVIVTSKQLVEQFDVQCDEGCR